MGLPDNLTTILDVNEYSYVSATAYDALARVAQYTLYTGMMSGTGSHVWLSYQRELDSGRLTEIRTQRETVAPSVVSDLNYTFDNAGNVKEIADTATGDNQCYT